MSTLNTINALQFDADVLQSSQPVLVDFYADWCGPCKTQTPILEGLAKTHGDKVSFVKVDVDASPELAERYKVRGIPTLILFKQGEAVEVKVGVNTRNDLIRTLNAHV